MHWEIDIAAFRRSFFIWWGNIIIIFRFERRILLPMPDIKVREEILRLNIKENHSLSEENFKLLAQLTEGF